MEVARFRPKRVAQRAGVRGSSVAPGGVRLIRRRGIAFTDPASTWAMLGTRLSFRDLVALGDAIVRRPRIPGTDRLERPPLAELSDLHTEAGRARRRGAVLLRQAAESVRTGSASPPETFIRLELLAAGLPEPDLDVDVRDRNGRLIGCSELAYREHRLAFEYESEHHRVDRRQWNRDIEKYHDYAASGWQVIRVTGDLLHRRRSEFHRRAHEGLRKARRRADRG